MKPLKLDTREALALVLDQVDYMHLACSINEAVGAVLPVEVLEIARASLEADTLQAGLRAFLVDIVTHWRLTANEGPLVLTPETLDRLVMLAGFGSFCALAREVERKIGTEAKP